MKSRQVQRVQGKAGKGREGKARQGKARQGKAGEGREGKGREGKGREGKKSNIKTIYRNYFNGSSTWISAIKNGFFCT